MPNVKCSQCPFRGPQTAFPLKSNGRCLKTCIKCAQGKANKAHARNHAPGKDRAMRRCRIQDCMAGDTPTLEWNEFLSLLHENRECAFELHSSVSLDFDEDSKENIELNEQEMAWFIARAVQDQTGYRFK